jgi:hypothetical protein
MHQLEVATPKARDLEGRHRNFQKSNAYFGKQSGQKFSPLERQALFGSLDPALTNLVHAASPGSRLYESAGIGAEYGGFFSEIAALFLPGCKHTT